MRVLDKPIIAGFPWGVPFLGGPRSRTTVAPQKKLPVWLRLRRAVYYASDLATLPYMQHDYAEAIRQLQGVLAMDTAYPATYLNLALTYAANQQFDAAIEAARKSVQLDGENPFMLSTLSYVNGRAGKTAEARRALQQLNDMGKKRPVSAFYRGFALLGLGDFDQAMNSFSKAYDERFYALAFVKVLPEFEPLRTDPRLKELVHRMLLPD